MNRNFKEIACFMATALLLTACAQDEMADGDTLPEGKYPLQIASVSVIGESTSEPWGAKSVQSRVAESTDGNSSKWEWNNTEYIGVRIGNGKPGKYVLSDKTVDAVTSCYWASTASGQSVTAWYPAYDEGESGTVDLSNQSQGLAYVLTGNGTGNYNSNVPLSFTHALAKVRVVLNGTDKEKVTGVKIKSYTSCTNTQGSVSTVGASEGWITMKPYEYNGEKCWEANVVPDHTITEYQVNDVVSATLEGGGINPLAAKINTIALTVGEAILQPGSDGKFTISTGDDVLIKDYDGAAPIVVNGDATLTLENVNININLDQTKTAVITVNRDTHLTLKITGMSNKLTSKDWGGILLNENASIEIVGAGKDASHLEVAAGNNEEIGSSVAGIGAASSATCGDITIKDVSVKASGGNSWGEDEGGAAIGTGTKNSACGNISITNSQIEATGGPGAAAIGLGYTYSAGNNLTVKGIKIDNSVIDATVKKSGWPKDYGACIGLCDAKTGGVTLNCGAITITNASNTFLDNLKFTGDGNNKGYKIGKGYVENANVNFSGGTFNDTSFTDGYGSW